MIRNCRIAKMSVGDTVEGFYLLKSAQPKVSSNGKPFLVAGLSDVTGIIEAKVWDYSGPVGPKDEGAVVKVKGSISEFRGALQLTADQFRLALPEEDYDLSVLVPVAPMDVEEGMKQVKDLLNSLTDPDYRAVCLEMLRRHEEAFRTIPAAKSVHHGFISGLLMHSLNMMKSADFISGLYSGVVDRSLLIAGAFLHDFAKEKEFTFSQLGLVTGYSIQGELLGHLVMGAMEVAEVARELGIPADKSMLLQHMLLSHHGEPEFGAAVKPVCAESELLSLIDKLDSRMEIYRQNLDKMQVGEMSQRIFALEKRIYKHQ